MKKPRGPRDLRHEREGSIFAGVAVVRPDEAIERANARRTGIGSSVWKRDLATAMKAAQRLEAGYTWVNSRTKATDEQAVGLRT